MSCIGLVTIIRYNFLWHSMKETWYMSGALKIDKNVVHLIKKGNINKEKCIKSVLWVLGKEVKETLLPMLASLLNTVNLLSLKEVKETFLN